LTAFSGFGSLGESPIPYSDSCRSARVGAKSKTKQTGLRISSSFGLSPQLAYLVLHEAMEMVAPGGVLSMLQQYNFLYNQQSIDFRRAFLKRAGSESPRGPCEAQAQEGL
jgi:hypothetical protein